MMLCQAALGLRERGGFLAKEFADMFIRMATPGMVPHSVARNVVFGLGTMVSRCGAEMHPFLPRVVAPLVAWLAVPHFPHPDVQDNACSALCHLVRCRTCFRTCRVHAVCLIRSVGFGLLDRFGRGTRLETQLRLWMLSWRGACP